VRAWRRCLPELLTKIALHIAMKRAIARGTTFFSDLVGSALAAGKEFR